MIWKSVWQKFTKHGVKQYFKYFESCIYWTPIKIHKLGFTENDLWIAAAAKKNKLIIVSSDTDFKRMQEVLDIVVESWYNPL